MKYDLHIGNQKIQVQEKGFPIFIEYIRFNTQNGSSGPYINTGLNFSSGYMQVLLNFKINRIYGSQDTFMSFSGMQFYINSIGGPFRVWSSNSTTINSTKKAQYNKIYNANIQAGTYKNMAINGEPNIYGSYSRDKTHSLYIGGWRGSSYQPDMNVYGCIVNINNTKSAIYRPCISTESGHEGEYGLYDSITNTYLYNANSNGSFTGGPVINQSGIFIN